jgi:hypothetical protein
MAEKRAPGDAAPPGTGEDACPACHGTGRLNGEECDTCAGSVEGVGGA